MMKSNVILFSAFHKPYITPKAEWVVPVHAGKKLSNVDLQIQGDDTGDNISSLNPTFCELTMAYWIWKNADRSKCKYWGLMHYRRYLVPQTLWTRLGKRKAYHLKADQKILDKKITSCVKRNILKDLKSYDVIVPHIRKIERHEFISIKDHYKREHVEDHWNIMIAVILEKYPEYQSSINIYDQDNIYYFNMMITSWEIWDKYLAWLFDILMEVAKRIDTPTDSYQKRFPGFLAERLLNLYIHHNKLRVKEYLTVTLD